MIRVGRRQFEDLYAQVGVDLSSTGRRLSLECAADPWESSQGMLEWNLNGESGLRPLQDQILPPFKFA